MKKHFHTYKIILGLLPILLLGFISSIQGQVREQFEFKIQYMAEENDSTWGVFVRPIDGFDPGDNDAVVGSGQVTILMNNDGRDSIHNIQSVGGTWNSGYDVVRNACEAPGITYLFVGMKDGDGIVLENGEETLLFTFQVPDGCPDTLGLLDHFDPFLPEESNNCHGNGPGQNSSGNNPGQDLSVFNSSTGRIHNWAGNYAPQAFSCGDCDNDGIVDGIEDTNGDGVYSSPPDSSGICDVCDPLGINMFAATLVGGDTLTMCGEIDEDSIAFMVEFTGGWEPFTIELEETDVATNATNILTYTNYYPGDRIYVSPTATSSYRMVRITDSPPTSLTNVNDAFCELTDVNNLLDTIEVTVEGPLTIDDAQGPFDFTACNLDTLGFGVTAFNGGEGIIQYQWQVSTSGIGGPWSDVENGTPYAFATTDSIIISNPLGLDGNFYRAKVFTETCDTLYSIEAELGVDGPFIIDVQPIDLNACAKEDPIYFHTETSVGQGVFNRKWQVDRIDGNGFVDLAASDTFNFGTRTDLNPTPEIERAYFDTVFVDTAAYYMNQWQFRLAAVGDNIQACTEIYTDAATMNVEGRIFIDDQPDDVLICSDTVACFAIAHSNQAENGDNQFQWYVQERGATTWTAISNDGTYSGTRSDTLCVTNPLGRDSFAYRVDVWTTECEIITSDQAYLNIDGPILFNDSPDDVTVCAEEDPNIFAVETWMGQGALVRRWQISTDDGATWNYLDASVAPYSLGIDSTSNPAPGFEIAYHDTLHINTATSGMDQYQYRVAVIGQSGGNCEETYSREAVLTVEGPITIAPANQPDDVFICSDTTACFSVLVDSESSSGIIEYQWYVKERGVSTWAPISNDGTYSGARTDTLCVTNVLGRDSFSYHVRVMTGLCQTILSDSAFLRVDGPINFNTDAEDITVCADEDPNIFAVETWMGQGILNRRWQVNRNDGNDWVDLTLAAPFSVGIDSTDNPAPGYETAYNDTLYINTAVATMNQWQFRVAAIGQNSNNCEDSYSIPATLTVEGAIAFSVQPVDVAICSDTAACFGVTITSETGEGTIEYQWYAQARGTSTWVPLSNDGNHSGARTDTLCVTNVAGRDSFLYRVDVKTGLCAIITSDSALLSVDGPIIFNANPEDYTVCGSEDANYFAVETFMGQGVLSRRWQVNRDDGNDWVDLSIAGIYSLGIDSIANPPLGEGAEIAYYDTLHINTADATMNQWEFRIAASGQNSNNCTDIFSREAVLTVEGPLTITVQPESIYLCSDTAACFGVSIMNETMEGNVQYQWYIQEKGDAPTDWAPLSSSDGRYAGVRSDTLCVLFIAGQDSTRYRVGIRTTECNEVLSDGALLQVDGPIAFVTDPSDETICAEEDAIYFVSEATIGQGRMNTFWEVSTDDGASWNAVDLSNADFDAANRVIGDANTPSNLADSIYHDTLFLARVDNTMDQWRYRNTAGGLTGGGCEDVNSADAILTVEGLIAITVQPVDVSICSDTAACFGVSVSNETMQGDIKYQWQTQAPGSTNWITLTSSNGRYGGVTSDTLCVNNVTGLDSFLYRVYIFTNTCANEYSDSARLNVAGPVDYVAEPQDAAICADEDATFFNAETTIGQGGLVTRWELSEDTGQTWVPVDESLPVYTFSSTKEANASPTIDSTYFDTLHINAVATADMDGNLYRVVSSGLNGTSCKDIPSDPGKLTVHGPLTVLAQPQDDVVCSGKPGLFRVNIANASSGDVDFLWQYSLENAIWYDININTSVYNGGRDSVLSISDVASVVNGDRDSIFYRVVFGTNLCDGDTSDVAKLLVEGPFEFDNPEDHPHDTIVCAGETIIFNANPTNYGFGDMMFQWKVNTTGLSTDWADADLLALTGGGTVTGAQTTQLVINPSIDDRALLDSALFRLDITSGACPDETNSEAAIVRIDGQLVFTQQPRDTVNCADKGVIFFANVTNEGFGGDQSVQFRWQEYEHNTMTWRDVQNEGVYNGASTDTLSIDITTGLDSNQYRVVVWTSVCNEITSDAAYLIEEGSVSFMDHPEDVIICSGEATSFSSRMVNSTGQGDNILNWQISTNNGISWANIDTGVEPLFSDVVTGPGLTPALDDSTTTEKFTTLNISDVEGMQGYRFRTAATSTYCDTVFSQLAKLTVEGPFFATLTGPATVCANEGTTIEANVINLGAGLPVLTWQYKGPDSTDFANVPTTWDIFHGEETNGIGVKVLSIDSVLNEPSRLNDNAIVDTFFTLNNYEFRLAIVSDTCEIAVYSDTFTLNVVSDRIGGCDWDLDGLDNTTDLDDDNDGLTDSVEAYITTYAGSEPQDSINQFDTDTDNNSVTDNEEDADEDTISNGEEVDDDDGDGQSDGVNTTTGVFTGFPAMPDPSDEDPDDIFNGDPLDPCDPILSPSCIGVVLDINVKLQGAMPQTGNDITDAILMQDKLRSDFLIPRNSPYENFKVRNDSTGNIEPAFVHVKRDSVLEQIPVADSLAVFGSSGFKADSPDNAVVDWVFVEIRDGSKLDSVVTTRAALLQRDGDVRDHRVFDDPRKMDADGYAYLSFDSTLAGDYYVVVRHRNHLGVMTNTAGLYSPIVTRVDYTEKDFNALGIHSQRMNFDSTEQYMWAGDVTSDRKIIYQGPGNDIDDMFFRVIGHEDNQVDNLDNFIVPGYYRTDYNLDGRSIFQGPNNDRQLLIFNSILAFPDNKVKFLANYVILEQLP